METTSQQLKELDGTLSSLSTAIRSLNLAKDNTSVKLAKDVLGSAGVLLTTIRVRFLPAHVGRLLTDLLRIRRSKKRISYNWG